MHRIWYHQFRNSRCKKTRFLFFCHKNRHNFLLRPNETLKTNTSLKLSARAFQRIADRPDRPTHGSTVRTGDGAAKRRLRRNLPPHLVPKSVHLLVGKKPTFLGTARQHKQPARRSGLTDGSVCPRPRALWWWVYVDFLKRAADIYK